ncbi:RcpC/CpaB family pilus assembly protein [Agromyces sp. SYSU T00194]|uniref:RcpC/CpaB family pilus assembly protein n=1 Tax=Agromyces chitinivorans TaxID=3158560 RepID=UPI00339B7A72
MRIRIIGAIAAIVLAAAGAFLVVNYVNGADERAAAGAELVDVYVVEEDVPRGTSGEAIADFVVERRITANAVQPGVVEDLAELAGLVTTTDLLIGEQLVEGRFASPLEVAASGDVPLPDGAQEVTIALSVDRVAGGTVRPGSTVGVVGTVEQETEQPDGTIETESTTQFVYHKMLVTRIQGGTALVSEDSESTGDGATTIMVTFAATTPQVERLVWAAEGNAGIWLTLEPESASESGSSQVTGENFWE